MSAYLVMKMEIVRGIPRCREVDIYSSPANSLTVMTGKEFYVDIESINGKDYQEAYDKMKDYIYNYARHLKWTIPFIEKTITREDLQKEEENKLNVALEHMGEIP